MDVILPCLDEAAALPSVLARLPPGYRAIVVDNASTDHSADVAAAHGALVVPEPRRGFGAAAHAGLVTATADVVCFCDADGSLDLAELPRVADAVRAGQVDLQLGRRRPVSARSWPVHGRLANAALTAYLRRRSGVPLHDIGPMRAANRTRLLELELTDRRSGYPLEMILSAHRAGWRIGEVDVRYLPRIGRSKVTGTLRGTMQAVRDMQAQLAES